jgi:glycosyltransferase involved in cell wall biosynthesis
VSFEGTDPSSQAGGLGVRVSGLAKTLADLHYDTHLFFVGDPRRPGEERAADGFLTLHRWSQWISAYCGGVYDAEEAKVRDFTTSLPPYLLDRVIRPALASGRLAVIMFEEWQTAACACALSDLLIAAGLRDRVVVFWTANNSYGFHRIDWARLAASVTIATISRYMRSIIRSCGVDAQVIPNGIPAELLEPMLRRETVSLRRLIDRGRPVTLFFKMARWEREKGWMQALGAVSEMRDCGHHPLLVARSGGPSAGSEGLVQAANARGLRVAEVDDEAGLMRHFAAPDADVEVINLRFGVNTVLARRLFAASDAVLANSVYEPFGLVGLEAMAAGGVIYTGGTGEDYAVDGRNAVVLQSLAPEEIVGRWEDFEASPPWRTARVRRAARLTARDYSWQRIAAVLLERVAAEAARQGVVHERPRVLRLAG